MSLSVNSLRCGRAPLALAALSGLAPLALAHTTPDPFPPDDSPVTPAELQDVEARLASLESENRELNRKLDTLAGEYEKEVHGEDVVPPIGPSRYGLGPAASKIYSKTSGLSIGGYGEWLYVDPSGPGAQFDALRAVLYFGYKFDENWLLNTEIEFEHGGTSGGGEAALEFAYLDYLHKDALNFRGGLVLVPMGFINELHEPVTFLSATRPLTEQLIMPATWRENGLGVFGHGAGIDYRAYIVNGLDAAGYTAEGLRGGRQKGSRALAEDMAVVARADFEQFAGWKLGGSFYAGNAGQGQSIGGTDLPDVMTTIYELHAEYRAHGLWGRVLGSMANVSDAAALNDALGKTGDEGVGSEMLGYYATLGYEVLQHISPGTEAQLSPYIQYENINTQDEVPDGFTANPANHDKIFSFGLNWRPITQIVFKLEYQDWNEDPDKLLFNFGYVF